MTTTADALDVAYTAAVARGDDVQARVLEQAQHESSRPPRGGVTTGPTIAMWYANRGLRVFPVMPGEKRPLPRSRGVNDATTDPETISRMWSEPGRNIGVATGDPYDVIDVDGPHGTDSFRAMLSHGSEWLVVRGVSETPRGIHLWVPAVPEAHNQAYASGVDYRAAGGYVVVPPSHVNGTVYRWLLPPVV